MRISHIRLCAWKGEKQFPSITATSAYGYKQTLAGLKTTSALHPGADLLGGVSKGLLLTRSGYAVGYANYLEAERFSTGVRRTDGSTRKPHIHCQVERQVP